MHNNVTALEHYADVNVNGTYSLQTRVAFIADIGDNLYELHFNNLIIDLKPRENQQVPNTLGVRHECAERGLIAPRLSTMFARKDETNSLVCVWECALSHVRSPFNSFPPMYNAVDKDEYMCVPIPKDFTAVRFAFDVHLRVSTSGPIVLTQSFYDDLNALAAQIRYEAGTEYGESIVILTLSGSLFEDMSLDDILQAHALNQNQLSNLQIVNVAPSNRRLMASSTAVKVDGVLITPETDIKSNEEVTQLKQTVDTSAAKSIQEFVFEPTQQVVAVDPVIRTQSFQQLSVAATPSPAPGTNTPDDTVGSDPVQSGVRDAAYFYVILIFCATLCCGKTMLQCCHRSTKRY